MCPAGDLLVGGTENGLSPWMGAILTELVDTGEKRDGLGRRIVAEDNLQRYWRLTPRAG